MIGRILKPVPPVQRPVYTEEQLRALVLVLDQHLPRPVSRWARNERRKVLKSAEQADLSLASYHARIMLRGMSKTPLEAFSRARANETWDCIRSAVLLVFDRPLPTRLYEESP